jgi:hypothetical protein
MSLNALVECMFSTDLTSHYDEWQSAIIIATSGTGTLL